MGWSCLQTQSNALDKILEWESKQPGYVENKGNYIFFEFNGNDKDYGYKEDINLPLEIYEVINNQAYRRGSLYIKPDGSIINRSYIQLPF